jgi:TIR domain
MASSAKHADATKRRVFISHSFVDKWIAGRIRDDLEARGVTAYLAEKDLATGAEIVPTISEELRDSDELLILLTPASVKSDWVVAEMYMALAYSKPWVAIRMHVGENDIPRLLKPYLARDLNDIDRYYAEVDSRTRRAAKKPHDAAAVVQPQRKPQRKKTPAKQGFSIGDVVRIVDAPQEDVYGPGKMINWVKRYMDPYCGKTATVMEVDKDGSAKLDIDGESFWWAFEWLTKAGR